MTSLLEFAELAVPASLSLYAAENEVMPAIDPVTGYFPGTINLDSGLDVAKQKRLSWAAFSGVGNSNLTHLHRSLLACEATMQWINSASYPPDQAVPPAILYPGPDGSYPAQKFGRTANQGSLHNKMMGNGHMLDAIVMADDFGLTTFDGLDGVTNLSTLIDNLETTAVWLEASTELVKFFKQTFVCNQLWRMVTVLATAGKLLSNATLTAEAQTRATEIFANHMLSVDGGNGVVFQEKAHIDGVGFDTTYHRLSCRLLMDYMHTLPDGAHRTTCMNNLILGLDHLMLYIGTDGHVDTSDNTRTEGDGVRVLPGVLTPKGINVDVFRFDLHMATYVTGDPQYAAKGDLVSTYGEGFGHIEDDGDDEEEEEGEASPRARVRRQAVKIGPKPHTKLGKYGLGR